MGGDQGIKFLKGFGEMSTLFLVATPIGNLEDISARAIRTLREVSLVAAEDTRETKKLMTRYQINTKVTSYHEHNKIEEIPRLLDKLGSFDIALVSDAGTPALNDPGYELVRAAIQAGHTVSPIPGSCAPIAALIVSGLPTDRFMFLGYFPRKKQERRKLMEEISTQTWTLIALETPHRLKASLEDLADTLGEKRQIVMARELTKLHEEVFRGSIQELLAHFDTSEPRGEITLVIAGYATSETVWPKERLMAQIQLLLNAQKSIPEISNQLAKESGWSRREIYRLTVKMRAA
jgi:16S rRNA (cytidine1402-2'-O)-methyltransferase